MAKIIVVTSGKGGVGKTTTSINFGIGLAQRGFKTVVIDFDMGLRNLDLMLGCESRIVYDLFDLIHDHATLKQALIKDKRVENLYILAASQTRDKDTLNREGLERVFEELKAGFDYIVCDSPAGIEWGAQMALYFADEALVISNPEVSSVRDADQVLRLIATKSRRAQQCDEPVKEHLVLTRYDPNRVAQGQMLPVDDVAGILNINLLGAIPECKSVVHASNTGMPVILNERSIAGQAYGDLVDRYLGEDRPHRFLAAGSKSKGFFSRMFGN